MNKLINFFPAIVLIRHAGNEENVLHGFVKTGETKDTIFAVELSNTENGLTKFPKRVWEARTA